MFSYRAGSRLSENLMIPKSTESVRHLYVYKHLIAFEEYYKIFAIGVKNP